MNKKLYKISNKLHKYERIVKNRIKHIKFIKINIYVGEGN